MKQHSEDALHSEYVKVLEQQIDIDYYQQSRVNIQFNEVQRQDNILMNILDTSDSINYLSYKDWSTTKRSKLKNEEGVRLFSVGFQLSSIKRYYFRQIVSVWEIAGQIGGFATAILFCGKFCYEFSKTNSSYTLSQQFMKSQYQTRSRGVAIGLKQEQEREEREKKRRERAK
jgi:hypothetical protein